MIQAESKHNRRTLLVSEIILSVPGKRSPRQVAKQRSSLLKGSLRERLSVQARYLDPYASTAFRQRVDEEPASLGHDGDSSELAIISF
jgi:hypothetical protein